MTVSELREELRQLAAMYFKGATVKTSKQSFTVKPVEPLVTLTMGSVNRPLNPPTKIIQGQPVSFYPATMPVQIDLFTHGRQIEVAEGHTPIVENTAEDDMLGFADFLNSEFVVQWCRRKDIAIVPPNTVQDLTGLINETNYEFRAMLEVMVYFTMAAIGYTGTLSPDSVKHEDGSSGGDIQAEDVVAVEPEITVTPSGGGNEELLDEESGYFSNVEINDKPVKEETLNERKS